MATPTPDTTPRAFSFDNRWKGFTAFVCAIVLRLVSLLWLERARTEPVLTIKEWLHADELALVFLVIGFLYIVGTDLLKETFGKHFGLTSKALLREIHDSSSTIATHVADGFTRVSQAVATGSTELRKEMALAWVRGETSDFDGLKEVARSAYSRSYGHKHSQDFCKTLESVILDRSMGPKTVFRSDQVTRVSLSRTGAPSGLLVWEEDTSFDLVPNVSGSHFSHRMKRGSRFAVETSDVLRVLQQSEFSIQINGVTRVRFSLPENITVDALKAPDGYRASDGDIKISYDGKIIEIEVGTTLEFASADPVKVQTYEKSFLREDDNFYALSCPEPVRNFNLSFNVERRYFRLNNAIVGPRRYWRGDDATLYANQAGWPDTDKEHFCSIVVPRWVLPGLVLAMTWETVDSQELAQPAHRT
jgi:hypothetical protein